MSTANTTHSKAQNRKYASNQATLAKSRGGAATRSSARAIHPSLVKTAQILSIGLFCAFGAFATSSEMGQVLLEKSRIEGKFAKEMADTARAAESLATQRVELLSSASAAEDFGLRHHMIAPEQELAKQAAAEHGTSKD